MQNFKKLVVIFILFLFLTGTSQAQNNNLQSMLASTYGYSIQKDDSLVLKGYVITASDIENIKARNIYEVLSITPPIRVHGKNIFLHGVQIDNTYIKINGFTTYLLDLESINVNLIQSIEIIDDEILITTKKNDGKLMYNFDGDTLSSFDDYRISVGLDGLKEKLGYALNYYHSEEDSKTINSFTSRAVISNKRNLQAELSTTYTETNGKRLSFNGGFSYMANRYWLTSLKLFYIDYKSDYDEILYGVDFQNKFYISSFLSYTIGGIYEKSSSYDMYLEKYNAYTKINLAVGKVWLTELSVKLDKYNSHLEQYSYNAKSSWQIIKQFQVWASYSTDYKPPTLCQLHQNRQINAESSEGFSVGIISNLFSDKLIISGNYFDKNFDDLIIGDKNIDKAHVQGVDSAIKFAPIDMFAFTVAYSYLYSEDIANPMHSIYGSALFAMNGFKLSSNINYISTDEPYTLINAVASYQFSKEFQLFTKVENIVREDRYRSDEVLAYIGLSIKD